MDLSFARTPLGTIAGPLSGLVVALPTELAILLVGVATRQAASPTARVQAQLDGPVLAVRPTHPLAPSSGAFHALAAAALRRWQGP